MPRAPAAPAAPPPSPALEPPRRLPPLVATVTDPGEAKGALLAAARAGRVALEVRIDRMAAAAGMELVGRLAPECAVVATCRRKEEGGGWTGPEIARRQLLVEAARRGAFVDWESETPGEPPAGRLVLSRHLPRAAKARELVAAAEAMEAKAWGRKVAALKVAAPVDSFREELRLLAALREHEERLPGRILIAMGGAATRLLGVPLGAASGYASAGNEPAAPGQLPWHRILAMWDEWNAPPPPHDALYLLLGNPAWGSLSPSFQNAALRAAGAHACYLPLESPVDLPLSDLLPALEELGVAGATVTMPFKEQALAAAASAGTDAESVGAANTLVHQGGTWRADNTDLPGIEKALFDADCTGGRALILGSGGSARAAVAACGRLNFEAWVCARNEATRRAVAGAASGSAPWGDRGRQAAEAHLVVNCTPIGMKGTRGEQEDPLEGVPLAGKAVLEMVTSPRVTPLAAHAERDGARLIEGRRPLLWQGVYAYRLLTGAEPDAAVMDAALGAALARREEPVAGGEAA